MFFKRKRKVDVNKLLGDSELDKWIKKQRFDPTGTYLLQVGDKDHPPTQEMINQLGELLGKLTKGTRFIVVPYYVKLIRIEEVEE
jgi:hypothetical protein